MIADFRRVVLAYFIASSVPEFCRQAGRLYWRAKRPVSLEDQANQMLNFQQIAAATAGKSTASYPSVSDSAHLAARLPVPEYKKKTRYHQR
ncbi:hypothetical protein [Pseudoduganella danionis]